MAALRLDLVKNYLRPHKKKLIIGAFCLIFVNILSVLLFKFYKLNIGNKIKIPTKESIWSVKGNNILSDNSPVVLQWNNGEGIIFEKKRNK